MDEPRVALVTGASSGIGRETAVELARAGFTVVLAARRRDRLDETADAVAATGGTAVAHELDVTDPGAVETVFAACEERFGVVDTVVNNAGMSRPDFVDKVSAEDVVTEVATNLTGPMLVTRRAVQRLRETGRRGDLVFVTSDAVRHARPRQAVYAGTKAGLEQFAHSVGLELEGTGIRCSIVRVGPTLTEFGAGWDPKLLGELLGYWQRFGLQRNHAVLEAADVARAIATTVTAPPGVHYDTIEIQPVAPLDGA